MFLKDIFQPKVGSEVHYPVKIDNLVKQYGSFTVLDGIGLNLKAKECVGIVGLNGVGKTTLFQCLMGLVKIQEGNISILGHEVVKNGRILTNLRNIRPRIGYVPEVLEIYPFLTLEEYLTFLENLLGLPTEDLITFHNYLIEIFDLDPWRDTLVRHLSRGNHQKLTLSTALVHRPELLVLDEPFTNIDMSIKKQAKKLLQKFITTGIPELGINRPGSILISSHILPDLEDLCTRVIIMHSGKIAWEGPISRVKRELTEDKTLESLILEVWDHEAQDN